LIINLSPGKRFRLAAGTPPFFLAQAGASFPSGVLARIGSDFLRRQTAEAMDAAVERGVAEGGGKSWPAA
jgi:hypothetical protein